MNPADFSPPLLRIQTEPPPPLAGWMLRVLLGLITGVCPVGRARTARHRRGGRRQAGAVELSQDRAAGGAGHRAGDPGEGGRGGAGRAGSDPHGLGAAGADVKAIRAEYDNKRLALRRIDAQLAGKKFCRGKRRPGRPVAAGRGAARGQRARLRERARRRSERCSRRRATTSPRRSRPTPSSQQVLPHYIEQEQAFEKLTKDGFTGRIMYTDKQRERIEKEQDLRTQEFTIRSSQALIAQSEKKIAQISADYRRQLQTERVEVAPHCRTPAQELAKHAAPPRAARAARAAGAASSRISPRTPPAPWPRPAPS